MQTIPRDRRPDWVTRLLQGRKNCEVKERNGHYYLYTYRNVWDKKQGKPKKTVTYCGVLRERGSRLAEHGHVAILLSLFAKQRILPLLKKHFPHEWEELMVFALNRVISPFPLKRIGSWAEKTTLPATLGTGSLSGKQLARVLASVGANTKAQADFMQELVENGELLLYDGSVIFSTSGHNKLLEVGYDKDRLFLPKANITLLFSKDRNLPIRFRLFFGSVNEIRTIQTVIKELRHRNVMVIGDKGYYKNSLYDQLHAAQIQFILPLPRDDARILYDRPLRGVFAYHKRIIRYTSWQAGPYILYHYEDQHLKYVETSEYYSLKLKQKKVTFHEGWAGRIALLSNKKMDPREAYLLWKTRDRIEKAFDAFQNQLETDHPYVSREDVFRGYLFGSFVALMGYYLVLNVLQSRGINGKVSVEDVLFEFSKVIVEDRGTPTFAEIPTKVEKLANLLGVYDIITTLGES